MKAQEYIKARDIEAAPLDNTSVGRLSIDAEFTFAGKRGVVVSPKRNSVSDRYLSLLSNEGVSFVVAEGGSTLSFYEAPQKAGELHPVRVLKSVKARLFPLRDVFEYISTLLRQSVKKRESIDAVASNLLVARIADEEAGKENAWATSILTQGEYSVLSERKLVF